VFAFRIADLIRKGHVAKAIKEFIDIQCTHPGRISRDIQLLGKLVAPATLSDFLMKAVLARLRSGKIWMNIEGFGVEQFIEPYNKSGFFKAGLQNHLLAQLESTSLPMLLHYEDRNSMRHGVESRVPFVDVELINLVRRLPGVFLVEGAETKKILRSAVKGFIPDAIFQRRDKMGFQAAEERWVKGPGKEFVLDTVHETVTKTSGLFTQSTIKKFDRMVVGDDKYDNSIWRFLTFGAWIERFNVSV
jgi:asparagine synthase (glutamine-hydrolysing)